MNVQHIEPQTPVVVTAAAVRHFRQKLAGSDAVGIRLSVKESGCTGYMYVVDLASGVEDGDLVLEPESGVKLLIDRASIPVLQGTTVDYVREGLNSVLRFQNPNAQDYCGCGESFSINGASA